MLYFNESDDISVAGMQGNQTKLNHTDITHKYPTISPVTAQSCRIKRAQQQENFQDFMPTNYTIEVHCLDSFQQELSEKSSYVAVKRTVYRKIRFKKKKKKASVGLSAVQDHLAIQNHFQFPFLQWLLIMQVGTTPSVSLTSLLMKQ